MEHRDVKKKHEKAFSWKGVDWLLYLLSELEIISYLTNIVIVILWRDETLLLQNKNTNWKFDYFEYEVYK